MRGVTPDLDRLGESPWFLAQTLVVGTGFSLLGGYVTGRRSPDAQRLNGLLFAVLTTAIGLLLPEGEGPKSPQWVTALSVALCFVAGIVGAELARREAAAPTEEP